ncbi:phosphoenolpyruvate--protein phosphotransferase [Deinococcus wulumuqiensis]|uniref:phosphoenolpyruvate--protein phosphotransferase n=1 Tax=Deinococcus wulumuqiensis TaxID=980427 RepID=A0AAV4K8S0_9DEIO|nr:phosphoenolpyruvate--protein phosphotransferase [Deinococcus wulumuqiensis]QII22373.1 phosphoenolpyruvate--protein phosphotransferase [Deinococcus wulumuqiensis R12]GGI87730.1 phosphoenolpyruvate--protein phosphotransferase [Deinococcus wulumuqiensis]GGP30532.1 phosphoenolpyruvate--protein phosphotransferase [Deinococcus wulumuqiensis]
MIELPQQLVRVGAQATDKHDAIRQVAALLAAGGDVDPQYVEGMFAREAQANTFLGHGIAIPHGTPESRHLIRRTTVAALQLPQGVDWGEGADGPVHLVIGIAAASDEHLQILRRLTRVLGDEAHVKRLWTTPDPRDIVEALTGERPSAPVAAAPATAAAPAPGLPYSAQATLPNPQGMHARPATMLAGLVKKAGATVRLTRDDGRSADATRLMDLLSLGLTQGTRFTVSTDQEALLGTLLDAIRSGLGDDLQGASPAPAAASRAPEWQPANVDNAVQGVGAADGLVIGTTRQHLPKPLVVGDEPTDPVEGAARLDAALKAADADLDQVMADVQAKFGADKAAIFGAHKELLADEGTVQDAVSHILDGHGPAWAYQQATNARIEQLQKLDDPLLAGRAIDLSDVQRRVLRHLLGLREDAAQAGGPGGHSPVILLAPDLTPSDTARLGPDTLLGFATAQGGPTSHTAIIARGLGLPAIVAAGESVLSVPDGTLAILDGSAGRLYLNPSDADVQSARDRMAVLAAGREAARAARHQPGATRDGQRVEVAANINRASAAAEALEAGAEGVGLMRTEFLFLERDSVPSEADQEQEYRAMAAALGDRPLIIRTLDIGGDKEVPYLGLAREDNSFLGIRGVRLCFERPDLFVPQLRAIVRVAKDHPNVHVMFPMIATLEDFRRARAMLDEVRTELGAPHIPLGVMIEVPSAALIAEQLAPEVDFFSVGTNDLTQYTLAMDRMHPQLARQTDAMHPAVLRLIGLTVDAAQRHGKWVGVCGGAAGDDVGALVLTGLGVKELSVSTPQVAGVKAALRGRSSAELRDLAARALTQPDAAAVRALVRG